MFDDYAKKIEELHFNAPKILKQVAIKGAEFATKQAKEITNQEGLVDTGYYLEKWGADNIELNAGTQAIRLQNNVEYASHLEYGHKLRDGKKWKGKFVGDRSLQETSYFCIKELDNALMKMIKKRARGK